MMPFIQGDPDSLPEEFSSYGDIIKQHTLEYGEVGWLTIDESEVQAGGSQRGYNATGIDRNVHVEVGRLGEFLKWGGGWNGSPTTTLQSTTQVLIANSVSGTCRVWPVFEERYTPDGDLSVYIEDYPENTGVLLNAGDLAKIGILTPHECVAQSQSGRRQFLRIVGQGVKGREPYFTINPKMQLT